MSMLERKVKRANESSNIEFFHQGYLIPESEIRKFIERLQINEINTVASRLQAVADLTSRSTDGRLATSCVQRIKRTARESKNKQYQKLMQAIISAVEQGPAGIHAANQTANRAVEIAFNWTYEYMVAFGQYKKSLRQMKDRVIDIM